MPADPKPPRPTKAEAIVNDFAELVAALQKKYPDLVLGAAQDLAVKIMAADRK